MTIWDTGQNDRRHFGKLPWKNKSYILLFSLLFLTLAVLVGIYSYYMYFLLGQYLFAAAGFLISAFVTGYIIYTWKNKMWSNTTWALEKLILPKNKNTNLALEKLGLLKK